MDRLLSPNEAQQMLGGDGQDINKIIDERRCQK